MMALATYVGTLQGSDPPNAKAPQGDVVDPADMVVVEATDETTADEDTTASETESADAIAAS
jgi:hypothetical protein